MILCDNCQVSNDEKVFRCTNCGKKLSAVPEGELFRQRFRIEGRIEEDECSITFAARDTRDGSPCRVREFFPQSEDRAVTVKFAEEARRLTSRGVALEGGCFTHEQRFYLAEPAIEGRTLRELRQVGDGPAEEPDHLLEEILGMVQSLRATKPVLVHGNLCASNIVRRRDGALVPINWAHIEDITQALHVRGDSFTLGTEHIPAWAPSERGRFGLTPASDLYGAAVAVMEVCSGREAAELFDSARLRWRWEDLGLPPPIETALQWMTETSTEARPQGPDAVLAFLRHAHAGGQSESEDRNEEASDHFRSADRLRQAPWIKKRIAVLERKIRKPAKPPFPDPTPVAPPPPALPVPKPTAPEPIPPVPPAPPVLDSPKKSNVGRIVGYCVLGAILVPILVFIFKPSPGPLILRAIARGNLVSPIGASGLDLFNQAQQRGALSPDAIAKIATQALPKIEIAGEDILRQFHDTSNAGLEDWENLKRLYTWASALRPGERKYRARLAYADGQLMMQRNRPRQAAVFFGDAAANENCWALAHNALGRTAVQQKNLEEAAAQYRKATECESRWIYPYQNLCATNYNLKNWTGAEAACRTAISIDSQRPGLHFYLGLALERQGRKCDAVAEHRLALQLATPNEDAFKPPVLQKHVDNLATVYRCGG